MERISIERLKSYNRKLLSWGAEAHVSQIGIYVYKEFFDKFSLETLQGKERKLLELEKIPHLQPYYPKVKALVENESRNHIKGYIMELINYNQQELDFQTRINILNKLKNILNLFRNAGYLYLDLRTPNIIINPDKEPILIDIDNIKAIDKPEIDCLPWDLQLYSQNGGQININAQILMFNKLARAILSPEINPFDDFDDITFFETDKPSTQNKKDEVILDETGQRILYELQNYASLPDCTSDHEYLHEHLKLKR